MIFSASAELPGSVTAVWADAVNAINVTSKTGTRAALTDETNFFISYLISVGSAGLRPAVNLDGLQMRRRKTPVASGRRARAGAGTGGLDEIAIFLLQNFLQLV